MRPLLLALLPLASGYYLNTHAPPPTKTYSSTRCTRSCAAHGCRHATPANSPAYFRLRPLYRATIATLMLGGGWLYATVNIGFYLLLMPALLSWLTYGALRNARAIRRLRRQV